MFAWGYLYCSMLFFHPVYVLTEESVITPVFVLLLWNIILLISHWYYSNTILILTKEPSRPAGVITDSKCAVFQFVAKQTEPSECVVYWTKSSETTHTTLIFMVVQRSVHISLLAITLGKLTHCVHTPRHWWKDLKVNHSKTVISFKQPILHVGDNLVLYISLSGNRSWTSLCPCSKQKFTPLIWLWKH